MFVISSYNGDLIITWNYLLGSKTFNSSLIPTFAIYNVSKYIMLYIQVMDGVAALSA